jgi:deferrochelatase/peroxidase EfeB
MDADRERDRLREMMDEVDAQMAEARAAAERDDPSVVVRELERAARIAEAARLQAEELNRMFGDKAADDAEKPEGDDVEGDKPDDDAERDDDNAAPAKAAGAHLLYA